MMKSLLIKSLVFSLWMLAHVANAQVTFVIESLPPSTQSKDTIFVCGSFNNWVPNDKRYIVQKQLSGQLSVTLPSISGGFEYKFTRGDWVRVETDSENKLIGNRKFKAGAEKTVYIKIENWLDQGGARTLNYIVLYFFACAFQAIALCLLAFKIQKKDSEKFKSFIFINGLITVLLLTLVTNEFSNPIWQTYLTFIFHVGLFCWGASCSVFLHHFLKEERKLYKRYLFGLPFIVAVFFGVIRVFNFQWFNFFSAQVIPQLTLGNLMFIGSGFIYNLILFLRMPLRYPVLRITEKNPDRNNKDIFVNSFYLISFIIILLIPLNIFILGYIDAHSFFEDFHVIGLGFTALIFTETFLIWRFPEALKEVKQPAPPSEDLSEWIGKLDNLMKFEKPYRNPELSVADLSEMLGTKSHVLSKVINEYLDKNFRDYLNKYRVEEFIILANTPEFKHFTFLALAQEVGFNSKSTFNLAFKKFTNQSPRDYFKRRETEEIES